jgi:capsular polysaccharide biosynthesis protein
VSEQALDLRSVMGVLRRRARWLVAAGVVGMLLGTASVALWPPSKESTALILLPTPTLEERVPSVATQVRIVRSTSILAKAGQAVRPALSARTVERRIRVSAPTNQLIQVTGLAPRAGDAQRLTQAIADAFVGYVEEAARTISASALADLRSRQSLLQKQADALQEEIDATKDRRNREPPSSASARKDAQLLAQLQAEQADIVLQLDHIKEQIGATLPAPTSAGGTSVVQDATPGTGGSIVQPLLLLAPIGFFSGVLLAAIGALALARKDPRIRMRDEIADAVGSTVLASVSSRPQRSVAGWWQLLERYLPPAVDAWAFRQALRALTPEAARDSARGAEARHSKVDHPRSLTVISIAGDVRGLSVGPQLATFAASLGISTRLMAVVGNDPKAAPLWSACSADRQAEARPNLTIGEVRAGESEDLTIVLAVVDRRQPVIGPWLRASGIVLAIAAGAATEEELARVAVAVDDAGRRIDGIVVTDPDRSDRTTGRHAMEERARQVALPRRLTGIRPAGVGDGRGGNR